MYSPNFIFRSFPDDLVHTWSFLASNLIVDHSLLKEEAGTQIIAARRYDTFWNTGDQTPARASLAPKFCRQYIAGWAPPGNCGAAGSLEADAPCDPGPPLRN